MFKCKDMLDDGRQEPPKEIKILSTITLRMNEQEMLLAHKQSDESVVIENQMMLRDGCSSSVKMRLLNAEVKEIAMLAKGKVLKPENT